MAVTTKISVTVNKKHFKQNDQFQPLHRCIHYDISFVSEKKINHIPKDTDPNFNLGTSNWKVGPITEPLQKQNCQKKLVIQNVIFVITSFCLVAMDIRIV